MNRTEAMKAILEGHVVEGVDGAYLRHKEHGGKYLFRWENEQIEWFTLRNKDWRRTNRAFFLFENFIMQPN